MGKINKVNLESELAKLESDFNRNNQLFRILMDKNGHIVESTFDTDSTTNQIACIRPIIDEQKLLSGYVLEIELLQKAKIIQFKNQKMAIIAVESIMLNEINSKNLRDIEHTLHGVMSALGLDYPLSKISGDEIVFLDFPREPILSARTLSLDVLEVGIRTLSCDDVAREIIIRMETCKCRMNKIDKAIINLHENDYNHKIDDDSICLN